MTFELVVTRQCNLNCKYCFEKNKTDERMQKKEISQIIYFINQYIERNSFVVDKRNILIDFNGGEALINKEFVYEFIKQTKDMRFTYSITTNGVLVDEDVISLIKEFEVGLQISLDGRKETHDSNRIDFNGNGSFDNVFNNLNKIRDCCKDLDISLVYTPDTVRNLCDNVMYIVENGFYKIAASFCADYDWGDDDFKIYEREIKKLGKFFVNCYERNIPLKLSIFTKDIETVLNKFNKGDCGACKDIVAILPNGDVLPCGGFVGCYNENNVKVGNIYTGIIQENMEFYLNCTAENDKCKNCSIANRCYNKCFAVSNRIKKSLTEELESTCVINQISILETDKILSYLLKTKNKCFFNEYKHFLEGLY